MDHWLENAARHAAKEPLLTLVDCGYVKHKRARDNADRLMRYVGRRNLQIVPYGRIVIHVPPKKMGVLRRFKLIAEGCSYSWTTHTYEKGGPQFGHDFCVGAT